MTKDELDLLRLDAIEAGERCKHLAIMNTPTDYAERIKAQIEYRKAREECLRAEAIYNAAVDEMIKQEMRNGR